MATAVERDLSANRDRDALQRARACFEAGEHEQARHLACQILEAAPDRADALHLLGMIVCHRGDRARAIELLGRAIRIEPAKASYHADLATVHQALNQPEAAIECWRRALVLDPGQARPHAQLAALFQQRAQLDDAIAGYRKALALAPDWAAVHVNLGLALRARGQPAEARLCFERALAIEPQLPEAHFNLGNAQRDLGQRDAAEASYRRALERCPDYVDALNNLALLLLERGALDQAEPVLRQALAIDSQCFQAQNNLGMMLQKQGRIDQAEACYRSALAVNPDSADAHNNLATVLSERGALAEAIRSYRRALELAPDFAEAYGNLSNALRDQGQLTAAAAALEQALRLRPGHARLHVSLADLYLAQGRLADARRCCDRALAITPGLIDAHLALGNIYLAQGRFTAAQEAYRRAVAIDGDHAAADSNYLFCLNFDPAQSDLQLFTAHRDRGRRQGGQRPAHAAYQNRRAADKRLRVGLVSADFGRHPLGYFLDPLLSHIDARRIEVVCYSGRARADDLTDRLRRHASGWRSTVRWSDQELAAAVRADGIDILVDLAGHTAGNRLGCFALRPAPVQVHWGGYCHSVAAVDYSLWDAIQVREGDERWFVETVVRLPDLRWCYAPPPYAPEVREPPALRQGFVTFGSFNNLAKVNREVIELWSRVLRRVPGSRLLLNWRTLADPAERARFTSAFADRGMAPERIELRSGADQHAGVLAEYSDVDIGLDPFPFSGCLTTCEALWMGLPVVTWPRTRPVSRQTTAFLTAIGRTEWLAETADDYVSIAAGLAADPDRLAAVRLRQRARILASPMCDGPRFARHFEGALRAIWRAWSS